MRILSVLFSLLVLPACSSVKTFELEDKTADFTPNNWVSKKQSFIQTSQQRVESIANELNDNGKDSYSNKNWEEAKQVLDETQEELELLKYASVRNWDTERDDFISTMNDLEEKYERVRSL